MGEERFSRRFGHRPEEHEIIVREDAPEDVRGAILTIAESDLDLKPSYLREVLCSVLRKLPDRNNWSEYPNVWGECQSLIEDCPWYQVYDFVEALYQHLQNGAGAYVFHTSDLVSCAGPPFRDTSVHAVPEKLRRREC